MRDSSRTLLIAVSIVIVVGIGAYRCPSTLCYYCTDQIGRCYTNTTSDAIPQNLSENLKLLEVHYQSTDGSKIQLQKSMLIRYPSLESLYLYGNFTGIEHGTLEHLVNLTNFYIKQTKIETLPKNLFANNSQLKKLWLIENPIIDFPTHVFGHGQPAIHSIYIFDNLVPLKVPCLHDQLILPSTWKQLTNLHTLYFTNIHFYNPSCHKIGHNFFNVGLRLHQLTVEGTNLFSGSQKILLRLKFLDGLLLKNVSPYKDCPALAKTLLSNLPTSLRGLSLNHWESESKFNKSCLFSRETLHGLEKLKGLHSLSFAYNSQALGTVLHSHTLPRLHLKTLQLNFCHISAIESQALSKYTQLQNLYLDGNAVLPHDYQGYRSHPLKKVKLLSLKNVNLNSHIDHRYSAIGILCSYPRLEILDMSSNVLQEMPVFSTTDRQMCNTSTLPSLRDFFAENNRITEFSAAYYNNSGNLCDAFPYLKKLNLNHNLLRSLDGLEKCADLEELHLGHNRLGYGTPYKYNSAVVIGPIRKLSKLRIMDLSNNNLRHIDVSLLSGLPHLKSFHFQSNNLNSIGDDLFEMNTELSEINLSWNYIKSVKTSTFSQMPNLTRLDLSGNLITSFPTDFFHMIDSSVAFQHLYIGNNPFYCGCSKELQQWAIATTKIYFSDEQFLTCSSPSFANGQSVYDYEIDTFECYYKTFMIGAASVVGGFLVTLLIALPCYKYRWYIRHIRVVWNALTDTLERTRLEHVCEYDAYVSYDTESEDDQRWVAMELIDNIEECPIQEGRLKLYVEGRDARGGECRMSTREVALKDSRKILIVVSNSYLKSASCLGEADIAGYQMHGVDFYQPNRILVLVKDELNEEEIIQPPMSTLLLGNVIQVETEDRKKKIMWKKIRRFLSKSQYMYQKRGRHLSTASTGSSASSSSGKAPSCSFSLDSGLETLLIDD